MTKSSLRRKELILSYTSRKDCLQFFAPLLSTRSLLITKEVEREHGRCFFLCWLPDLLRVIVSHFSYVAQDHLPKNGTAHSGLCLPLSVDKIIPICMPISQSDTGGFSVEALLQITVNCVMLTTKAKTLVYKRVHLRFNSV